jgi:hypothetical protein
MLYTFRGTRFTREENGVSWREKRLFVVNKFNFG